MRDNFVGHEEKSKQEDNQQTNIAECTERSMVCPRAYSNQSNNVESFHQQHQPLPQTQPPPHRLPRQIPPYQNDMVSSWEQKVYVNLEPYAGEMSTSQGPTNMYNSMALQPHPNSPNQSGSTSLECTTYSTSGTPCEFQPPGQVTPPVVPLEGMHRTPLRMLGPMNMGEPIFPPPPMTITPRFPCPTFQQQSEFSPGTMQFNLGQHRYPPPGIPLPPYYSQQGMMNGNTAFQMMPTPEMMRTSRATGQIDAPRRKNATRQATAILKNWLMERSTNPYPSKQEKHSLANKTGMNFNQISTWFANARRRLKKENKMTWPAKTGSSESRPQVPELVRSDADEERKGHPADLLGVIPNFEHNVRNYTADQVAPPTPYQMHFTGETHQINPSSRHYEQPCPRQPPSPIFPQQLTGTGEGDRMIFEDSGEDSVYSNSFGCLDDSTFNDSLGGIPTATTRSFN